MLGANHVLVGPMRRDELRRAIERSARAGGLRVEPELVDRLLADVEAGARRAPAAVDGAARAVGAPRRPPSDARRLRAHRRRPRRGRAPRRGDVRAACATASARSRARSCCGWPASRPTAARVRRPVALGELDADREDVRRVLAALADGRLVTLVGGSRRGRARGAAARVAAPARLDRRGRRRPAPAPPPRRRGARVGGRRARPRRALPRRPPGRGAGLERTRTGASSTRPSARSWTRAAPRPTARHGARAPRTGACASCSRGVGAMLALALLAGALFLDQRGTRPRRGARAPRPSASAPRRSWRTELDRSLLLARQGVAIESSAQTRGQPARRAAAQPAPRSASPGARATGSCAWRRTPTAARSPSATTAGGVLLLDVSSGGPARVDAPGRRSRRTTTGAASRRRR